MTTEKKPFDPTVSFMFFGSWAETIECLAKTNIEQAFRLFTAIANYCMYDQDPDFSDDYILSAIWSMMKKEANSSIARRKSQFNRDELNDNYQRILDALQANPGFSHRRIAEMVGVSPSTVDRVCRKYPEGIRNSSAHPVSVYAFPAGDTCLGACTSPAGDTCLGTRTSHISDTHDGVHASLTGDTLSGNHFTDSYRLGYSDSDSVSDTDNDTMMQGSDEDEMSTESLRQRTIKYWEDSRVDMSAYEEDEDGMPF